MSIKKWLPSILTGVLAAGVVAQAEKKNERKPDVVEANPSESSPLTSRDLSKKQETEAEEKECDLRVSKNPVKDELAQFSDESETVIQRALELSADVVKEKRYHDAHQESRYFSVCRDKERWQKIQESIQEASEKTGVPERILIAIGMIESQFHENVHRKDTQVHGPYQMKLSTAKSAAHGAEKYFGKAIKVTSAKDLTDTSTAIKLASLTLKKLHEAYGQWGLAVVAYDSGHATLERKIQESVPDIDLGKEDWKNMERHHHAGLLARAERNRLLKEKSRKPHSEKIQRALKMAVLKHEQSSRAYRLAKESWQSKRDALPKTLADAHVTVLSLVKDVGVADKDHSLTYVLALDDIADRTELQQTAISP